MAEHSSLSLSLTLSLRRNRGTLDWREVTDVLGSKPQGNAVLGASLPKNISSQMPSRQAENCPFPIFSEMCELHRLLFDPKMRKGPL